MYDTLYKQPTNTQLNQETFTAVFLDDDCFEVKMPIDATCPEYAQVQAEDIADAHNWSLISIL